MVRRRGLRRHLTRNRSIALVIALVAFGIVGIQGADLGIEIFQAKAFEGTNFAVTIFDNIVPLGFTQNFAVQCSLWTQADMIFIDGTSRDLGFDTQTFSEQNFISLSVFDPVTGKELSKIEGEIRARCTSPADIQSFTVTGGEVKHFWRFFKVDDFATKTLSGGSQNISPSSNLLQPSTQGAGILLDTFSISADQINTAIATNDLDYQVNLDLWTEYRLDVQAIASGMTDNKFAAGGLASWTSPQLQLRIQNDDTTNPGQTPSDNRVIITKHGACPITGVCAEPSGAGSFFDLTDFENALQPPRLFVEVDLPNHEDFEGKPELDIFKADSVTGNPIGQRVWFSGERSFTEQNTDTFANGNQGGTQLNGLVEGVYTTVVFTDERTGTDRDFFLAQGEGNTGTVPVPIDPGDTPDPCADATGTELQDCEAAAGMLLSCQTGFTKVERAFFDVVAGTAGVIVQTQPGLPAINEFTTEICLANQTIEIFNGLGGGQCTDVNFVFDDTSGTCVCGVSLDSDGNCAGQEIGVASATSWILYEVVYAGENDIGSIRTGPEVVFSVPGLSLVGEAGTGGNLYSLDRIHVVPVITTESIPIGLGDPTNAIFIYKISGEVLRVGADEPTELGVLEECIPNNFFHTTEQGVVERQPNRALISPSTSCNIFDMNSVSIIAQGDRLGLNVEDDIKSGAFFQIARSDISVDQIVEALTAKSVTLNDGDKFKLIIDVAGDFLIGEGGTLRVGAVTPMIWEHELTWTKALEPNPCEGLTGDALEQCLRPIDKTIPSNCQPNETITQCWERNHPVKPKTTSDEPDCRAVFVGGKLETVCKGEPTARTQTTALGGNPENNPSGNPGTAGIGDCPAGSTATSCLQLTISNLEEKLTSLLGLSGSTITTLSNNAVLIIASIIAIIVIGLIAKFAIKRRRGF